MEENKMSDTIIEMCIRDRWNPGTLAGVIANERHCGDVLARKTFTPNFLKMCIRDSCSTA